MNTHKLPLLQVYMPEDLLMKLKAYSKKQGYTVSTIVRLMLENKLMGLK